MGGTPPAAGGAGRTAGGGRCRFRRIAVSRRNCVRAWLAERRSGLHARLPARPRSPPRLPHRVVVLHGQPGGRRRAPLRLPGDVLPGGRGPPARQPVALGDPRSLHGAPRRHRRGARGAPCGRTAEPGRNRVGGGRRRDAARLERRVVADGRGGCPSDRGRKRRRPPGRRSPPRAVRAPGPARGRRL